MIESLILRIYFTIIAITTASTTTTMISKFVFLDVLIEFFCLKPPLRLRQQLLQQTNALISALEFRRIPYGRIIPELEYL